MDIRLENKKPLGPYVEVETAQTLPSATSLPSSIHHLQTLGGSSKVKRRRYRIAEWTLLEEEISRIHQHYHDLERIAFRHICEQIYKHRDVILQSAKAVAELDVSSSLAVKAKEYRLVRPHMVPEPVMDIRGGRHLVVEQVLRNDSRLFQKNDCHLNGRENFWLITGPNMGGKSTFLRQNALLSIMAQMGSFVPADQATLGVVDRVFCRVGTSDDLSRHQSSFMVEMSEAAFILKRATPRSLVIMDEIGRGTSFRDGLCIAWAIARYLHDRNRCRVLFATHYHELAKLVASTAAENGSTTCAKGNPSSNNKIACWRTKVAGSAERILFTHELERGVSENSYGIHVARLAGLPSEVIQQAREMLQRGV